MKKHLMVRLLGGWVVGMLVIGIAGCGSSGTTNTTTTVAPTTTIAPTTTSAGTTTTAAGTTTTTGGTTTTSAGTTTTTTSTTTTTAFAGPFIISGTILSGECTYETVGAVVGDGPIGDKDTEIVTYETCVFSAGSVSYSLQITAEGTYYFVAVAPFPVEEEDQFYGWPGGVVNAPITIEVSDPTTWHTTLEVATMETNVTSGDLSGTITWGTDEAGVVHVGLWTGPFSGGPNESTWEAISEGTSTWDYLFESLELGDVFVVAAFYPGRSEPRTPMSFMTGDYGGGYSDNLIPLETYSGTGTPEAITIDGDVPDIDITLELKP